MIPEAILCHQAGSRARLRIPAMRDDAGYFERARAALEGECSEVRVDARTGSILLVGMRSPLTQILGRAAADDLFVLSGDSRRQGGQDELVPFVDRAMAGLFRGPRHWPAEMAAVMLLLAIIQIARGNIMAPAVSLLWYASEAMHWAELESTQH
jgi:hypothetical protein